MALVLQCSLLLLGCAAINATFLIPEQSSGNPITFSAPTGTEIKTFVTSGGVPVGTEKMTSAFVSANGMVSFVTSGTTAPTITENPPGAFSTTVPAYKVIAPYWVANNHTVGEVRTKLLNAEESHFLKDQICRVSGFEGKNFNSTEGLVATYSGMIPKDMATSTLVNNFQMIFVTDGEVSFSIYQLKNIGWANSSANTYAAVGDNFATPYEESLSQTASVVNIDNSNSSHNDNGYFVRHLAGQASNLQDLACGSNEVLTTNSTTNCKMCAVCPVGQYRNSTTVCVACPSPQMTNATGKTHVADCGLMCDGTFHPNITECPGCKDGEMKSRDGTRCKSVFGDVEEDWWHYPVLAVGATLLLVACLMVGWLACCRPSPPPDVPYRPRPDVRPGQGPRPRPDSRRRRSSGHRPSPTSDNSR